MARISTYAIESPAEAGDILLGSNTSNDTKNFTVGSIIDLIGINGTKDTIAMFGSGTSLKDSIKLTTNFIKQRGVKKFNYNLPVEINSDLTPETWKFKKI